MLYSRYSNPMMLLNQELDNRELADFVTEVMKIKQEENLWEFYLHRVFDKQFSDFLAECQEDEVPEANLEATVKHSFKMLENFQPT